METCRSKPAARACSRSTSRAQSTRETRPELEGAETLRAIKKKKTFANVRVVMMSGVVESMVRRRTRGAYDAFLRKPFDLDDLVSTIERLAKKR